jgi:hypothetical protein
MTYAETGLVATIERLSGRDVAALTRVQRDQLDQFHSGGTEAVDRLLPGLRLEPGMSVLDVGSGLGGPARQVAQATGADFDAAYTMHVQMNIADKGGFEVIEWVDETIWIREWFGRAVNRMAEGGTAATLPALLDDGPQRMLNFAAGIADGAFTLHRGAFARVYLAAVAKHSCSTY